MCDNLLQSILYRRFDVGQRVLEQFFCVAESLGLKDMVRLEDTPVSSQTSLLEMPCSPPGQHFPLLVLLHSSPHVASAVFTEVNGGGVHFQVNLAVPGLRRELKSQASDSLPPAEA